MQKRRSRMSTPAFVVALIALFVALGGTTYAATKLPKNSVGTKQLKRNAVTAAKIRKHAVTAAKINTKGLTVPQAVHATNASDASAVGGLAASQLQRRVTGTCPAGSAVQDVNSDGSVSCQTLVTAPDRPWTTINDMVVSAASPVTVLYSGNQPTKFNLTSLTLAAFGPNPGTVALEVQVYVSDSSGGDCTTLTGATFGAAERFRIAATVGQTVNITYPTPLVYTAYGAAGTKYCVDVENAGGPTGFSVYVSGSGFLS